RFSRDWSSDVCSSDLIVENRVVQDALLDRLHDSQIGLLPGARLEQLRRSGDDWLLTLTDGRQLRAPLLVAADGANSAVRRLAGRSEERRVGRGCGAGA